MNSRENKINNLALYRKYRSRDLDEILGQPQVTDILKSSAVNDNFSHSYLLVGQRGTGKTSVARILAHLINATDYASEDFDIIEIDAASHGSVDDARELRERANLAPMKSRNKVYIIDEVHMLSRQAFDALLKLIEEPPSHLYFILATTELQKVPATILSRVQKFTFRPVATEIVANHLREISEKENIAIDDEALLLIAQRGEGSFRDSITLLDQIKNYSSKISRNNVEEMLGLVGSETISQIIDFIDAGEVAPMVSKLTELFASGNSASEFAKQLISGLLKTAIDQPKYYELIEQLLDVAKSVDPQIKLISILANFSKPAVANIAPEKSQEKNTENTNKDNDASNSKIDNKINKNETSTENKTIQHKNENEIIAKNTEVKTVEENVKNENKNETSDNNNELKNDNKSVNFDWEVIIKSFEKLNEPAALAIARAADFRYYGDELILFFAKKFQRSKADTKNFRDILSKAIDDADIKNAPEKITISNEPVPEDSDSAKVLNILGGEAVSL